MVNNVLLVAHGMSGDFLRLTQIISTNIHKINQNGMTVFTYKVQLTCCDITSSYVVRVRVRVSVSANRVSANRD